ncbi:MAG: PEP-CTERM sorting domain-containing protein [Pirellulales bacterium]|nr:PEP-CTERM sorting domain-containing protein [Pirellulales bacterium]
MMCVKWKAITLVAAVLVTACVAWTGEARAVDSVDTNVAYMKEIFRAGSSTGACYYKPHEIYNPEGSDLWTGEPIINDDIWYQSPQNFMYVNTNIDAALGIDLTGEDGVTLDLNSLQLFPAKSTLPICNWTPYFTGCYLEAGVTTDCELYSMEIPTATLQAENSGNGARFWTVDLSGWTGVRYIRIRDTVDVPDVDDDLRMTEMRVRANVPGYNGFIGNVGVSFSDPSRLLAGATNGSDFAEPTNMVNNVGMTDQGGAGVGDPTAMAISGAGQYCCLPGDGSPMAITFDLQGSHVLDEMLVWNYTFATATSGTSTSGTKEVILEYSDNGILWTALSDTNGLDPGTHTFAQAPEEPNDTVYRTYGYQTAVDFGGVTATHVRMTQLTNYGAAAGQMGLNEVRFYEIVRFPGDANNSGTVDEFDARILAENWLRSDGVGWEQGDFNDDGIVDDLDASILAANWGNTLPPVGVPEPTTLVLLLGLSCGLLLRRRR